MRGRLFYALYFASPLMAVAIFAIRLRSFANVYFLSVALGLAAYTYLCNQFILAARPHFLVEGVGAKRLQILHVSMPCLILVLAALHRVLKLGLRFAADGLPMSSGFFASLMDAAKHGLGFKEGTLMADLGAAAWWLLLALSVLSALLFSKESFRRFALVRRLREFARSHGLGEEKARAGHAVMAVAALAVLTHVFLSSSSTPSSNAPGAVWLFAYLFGCVAFYVISMFRHRRSANGRDHRQPAAGPAIGNGPGATGQG